MHAHVNKKQSETAISAIETNANARQSERFNLGNSDQYQGHLKSRSQCHNVTGKMCVLWNTVSVNKIFQQIETLWPLSKFFNETVTNFKVI